MTHPAKLDAPPEAIFKRLEAVVAHAPDLAEPAAFYRAVLPMLRAAQAGIEPFTLAAETAQRKLEMGQPMLVGEDLPLEAEAAQTLFLNLCHFLERAPAPSKSGWGTWPFHSSDSAPLPSERARAGRQIRRAVERGELGLPETWQMLALGNWRRVELLAAGLQLDTDVLYLLAQNSLKPALRVWANGLKNVVDLDHWRRGQCPMCGSPPALSEIQGKEGARQLRCAMCGADWSYPRLQCAFCANTDYKSLGYISVAGEEEKYHLQTCDACRGYLKVMVTYDPTPVDLLPVEDLATLHLDLIATERDYRRVPVK